MTAAMGGKIIIPVVINTGVRVSRASIQPAIQSVAGRAKAASKLGDADRNSTPTRLKTAVGQGYGHLRR